MSRTKIPHAALNIKGSAMRRLLAKLELHRQIF